MFGADASARIVALPGDCGFSATRVGGARMRSGAGMATMDA
jgi:hypothetical protein